MEDLFMMLEVSSETGIETRQSGIIDQFSRSLYREREGSYHYAPSVIIRMVESVGLFSHPEMRSSHSRSLGCELGEYSMPRIRPPSTRAVRTLAEYTA